MSAWVFDPVVGDVRTREGESIASVMPAGRKVHGPLIAVAPELLAMARRVAAHFEDTDAPLGIVARNLIAIAEGRQ